MSPYEMKRCRGATENSVDEDFEVCDTEWPVLSSRLRAAAMMGCRYSMDPCNLAGLDPLTRSSSPCSSLMWCRRQPTFACTQVGLWCHRSHTKGSYWARAALADAPSRNQPPRVWRVCRSAQRWATLRQGLPWACRPSWRQFMPRSLGNYQRKKWQC